MKRNMLEKNPWSHMPHDVFAASCDGDTVKDMSSFAFDDTRMSSHGFKSSNVASDSEFCKDDCILNGTSSAADSNSYTCQLSHNPQTDDLNFFNNSCEEKESRDLLYNGWPDMGNFEDVDRMLRSCDSSFGLGVTGNNCNNNDEMSWFTLEDPLVECEEVLTMDFKVPCSEPSDLINISQDYEPPGSDNKRSSNGFENNNQFKLKDQGLESKDVGQSSNGRGAHFKKDNRMQVNLQKKKSKHLQSEGKEGNQCVGHDGNWWQKRNLEIDSFGYTQNNTYLHANYGHASNQATAGPVLTGMKSEIKDFTSPCRMESSYVPNQAHSMEHSGDPSLQGTRRKVRQSHVFETSFIGSPRQMGKMRQSSKCDLISAQKQVHISAIKLENQRDVEGFQKGASTEIGSLNVPESSSVSSRSDDISLEATSFHQLQHVMEHLDLRTKLCIKDGLYRLARSAEQRHSHAGLSGSAADNGDAGGPLLTQGTNKCAGFMDMETDTNPIDRSIAHLLFHRPSNSSNLPASSPLKPSATMHGFITSPANGGCETRLSGGSCK